MAQTQTFGDMLKIYRPTNILMDEVKKLDYMFRTVSKDPKWKGGEYKIPVQTANASSVKFGSMNVSSDISEVEATMAKETSYIKVFHSLKFNLADLDAANNYEGSFIQAMKDTLAPASLTFKEAISHSMLLGAKRDTLTANGTSAGVAAVSHAERFDRGEKVTLRNNDPAAADYYVISVDINSKTITLSATRGGSAADISAYTTAKASAVYYDGTVNTSTGAIQNKMNSLKDALLDAANGGDSTIHTITKTDYKQFQAYNEDLSSSTAATLLSDLYKVWIETSRRGRGRPSEILVSFTNFGYIADNLELNTRFKASDFSDEYGFKSLKIAGPDGSVKITALRDMDDDLAFVIDWKSFVLAGDRFFAPVKNPKTSDPYFEERSASGYVYIMDVRFYGNLIFKHLSYNGVAHSISI